MKTAYPSAPAELPDTVPGLLILQHQLSHELSKKQAAPSWQEGEADVLTRQNESLKKQLMELYCLTERLALAFKATQDAGSQAYE